MNSSLESKRDYLSASEYILQNFEAIDRIAVLVRDRRAGETIQRITTAKNAASPEFQAWLRHKNICSDVYIGMNAFKRDAQSRTKEDIETIRPLYLAVDHNGPLADRLDILFGAALRVPLKSIHADVDIRADVLVAEPRLELWACRILRRRNSLDRFTCPAVPHEHSNPVDRLEVLKDVF